MQQDRKQAARSERQRDHAFRRCESPCGTEAGLQGTIPAGERCGDAIVLEAAIVLEVDQKRFIAAIF
jgi:hypothetical protein